MSDLEGWSLSIDERKEKKDDETTLKPENSDETSSR